MKFLERNPTAFAFPSQAPPPPFPQVRKKKKRKKKPPDKRAGSSSREPCPISSQDRRRALYYHNRRNTDAYAKEAQAFAAQTVNNVWVPSMHRWLNKEVAILNGWEFAA